MDKLGIELVRTINNVCANCYKTTDKHNQFTVGSIDHFVFCSMPCSLEALKRKGTI